MTRRDGHEVTVEVVGAIQRADDSLDLDGTRPLVGLTDYPQPPLNVIEGQ
jgi:hypothetical protein